MGFGVWGLGFRVQGSGFRGSPTPALVAEVASYVCKGSARLEPRNHMGVSENSYPFWGSPFSGGSILFRGGKIPIN